MRYGYQKIRVLLNREGWQVGKYLVERIYREEGLTCASGGSGVVGYAEHRRERTRDALTADSPTREG